MTCERCRGFMIVDAYNDRYETGRCAFLVWRCLNCGDLIDSHILAHRLLRKQKAATVSLVPTAWDRVLRHMPVAQETESA
jgi:RNase P subunit RPR2